MLGYTHYWLGNLFQPQASLGFALDQRLHCLSSISTPMLCPDKRSLLHTLAHPARRIFRINRFSGLLARR
jgi:hypothetical protein